VPAAIGPLVSTSRYDTTTNGVAFWASYDGGHSFTRALNIGSTLGGGDSDIAVGPNHSIYIADLEATASAICSSKDFGKSWASDNALTGAIRDNVGMGAPCSGITIGQTGPEDDRPWVNAGPNGVLYFTYHDFVAGFPLIESSTDGGRTFAPCGLINDPRRPTGANYNPAFGTLVSKPVIGHDGSIYMTVAEPDQVPSQEKIMSAKPADIVFPALNRLYMAVARGGCGPTATFSSYPIYAGKDAAFYLFNQLGMDSAGNLYAVASGKLHKSDKTTDVWLFTSHTGGRTWSKPIRVNAPAQRGNMMAAVTGGLRPNSLAIGWFGTSTSGDANNPKDQWRYFAATSLDGGKTFETSTVTPSPIHYGDICTDGVFCGQQGFGSNRNLLDFSSITVNPKTGCVVIALPGDPWNRPDRGGPNDGDSAAFVALQNGGTCLK
jgi:hypothetical protein